MATLRVLGLGLRCPQQTTQRCLRALGQSDQLFLISDHLEKQTWLSQINPNFCNLMVHYGPNKPRRETYQEMADQVLSCLRQGHSAALVSYGHPLVFCDPSRLALEQTAKEGFELEILPGVSSIDCLLADLRVDVQNHGVQIYEAHDLLLHDLILDPEASQILFQVPSLGDSGGGWKPGRFRGFIRALAERLAETFGPDHEVVLYFGSNAPDRPTLADRVPLRHLHEAEMISEYTLWVPPLGYACLPADFSPRDQPVDLELVGYGPDWEERTCEVEALLQGKLFSTGPCPVPTTSVADIQQLPEGQPKVLLFPAHPCQSGAVEWARQAQARGWSYRIRPAISWEDRIYCDVPLDPGLLGFQSFPGGSSAPQPIRLSTLQRLPCQPSPEQRYWGPLSGFQSEPQPDSLGLYQDGPQPRPLENTPFIRALQLSAVERLVAFLQQEAPRLNLQKLPSAKLWLHSHLQRSGKELRQALENTDLAQKDQGNWAGYLLQNPEHPMNPYLLLKIRCQEALDAADQGVSLSPLNDWMGARL